MITSHSRGGVVVAADILPLVVVANPFKKLLRWTIPVAGQMYLDNTKDDEDEDEDEDADAATRIVFRESIKRWENVDI